MMKVSTPMMAMAHHHFKLKIPAVVGLPMVKIPAGGILMRRATTITSPLMELHTITVQMALSGGKVMLMAMFNTMNSMTILMRKLDMILMVTLGTQTQKTVLTHTALPT